MTEMIFCYVLPDLLEHISSVERAMAIVARAVTSELLGGQIMHDRDLRKLICPPVLCSLR